MKTLKLLVVLLAYFVSAPAIGASPSDLAEGKFVLTYHEKEKKFTLIANRSKLFDIMHSLSEKANMEVDFLANRRDELITVEVKKESLVNLIDAVVGHDYGLFGDKLVISSKGSRDSKGQYVFPVRPGMKEWETFETVGEMYAATQIPEDILKNMDTASLLNTCLDYPLIVNLMAFDTLQAGFDALVGNFNGLKELLTRKDAAATLLAQYQTKDYDRFVEQFAQTPDQQNADFLFKSAFTEMLLAQDDIITQITPSEQVALVRESLNKIEIKSKYPEYYGFMSLSPPGLIMKRVMENEEFATYNKANREAVDVGEHNIEQIILDAQTFVTISPYLSDVPQGDE